MGLVRNCPTFDVLHCGGTVFSVELCNVDRQELPGPFLEQGTNNGYDFHKPCSYVPGCTSYNFAAHASVFVIILLFTGFI